MAQERNKSLEEELAITKEEVPLSLSIITVVDQIVQRSFNYVIPIE